MAIKSWIGGTSGDVGLAGNYNPSGVPVSNDTIRFLQGSGTFSGANNDQSAINGVTLEIGGDFTGNFGTPSSPVKYGTGCIVKINGKNMQSLYLHPASASLVKIDSTPVTPNSVNIIAGTITDFYALGGLGINIGASCTITQLITACNNIKDLLCVISAGATITAARLLNGYVKALGQLVTANVHRATLDLCGQTAGSNGITTLLEILDSVGLVKWNAPGSTIASAKIYAGALDAREEGNAKVLTAGDVYPNAKALLDNKMQNITGAINNRGGYVSGKSVTITTIIDDILA